MFCGEFKSARCIVDITVYFAMKKKKLQWYWTLCLWLLLPRLLLSAHKGKLLFRPTQLFHLFFFFSTSCLWSSSFHLWPFRQRECSLVDGVCMNTHTHIQYSGKKGRGSGQSRHTPLHRSVWLVVFTRAAPEITAGLCFDEWWILHGDGVRLTKCWQSACVGSTAFYCVFLS